MNTQSNAVPEALDTQKVAPAVIAPTRPLYWSVRRELWENRWIYIAPPAVAAVFLFGFVISLVRLPDRMRAVLALDPGKQGAAMVMPYNIVAGLIMAAAFIIGFFYCLEALHAERRDRSILFWKSLPVSDLTTVLSKVIIIFILPSFAFVVTFATQLIMLLLSTAVLRATGSSAEMLWTQLSLFHTGTMLLYHLVTVHTLWYAPIYGWVLLVSAWARRAAFLWAFLPPLAICFVEKIVFNTWHFAAWLQYRLSGPEDFTFGTGGMPMDPLSHLAPLQFLSTPGLWIGLVVFAVFLAAAVRLRRHHGPI